MRRSVSVLLVILASVGVCVREREREKGREERREGGRERGREGGREGRREGREGGREGEKKIVSSPDPTPRAWRERGSGDIRAISWANKMAAQRNVNAPIRLQNYGDVT